MSSTKDAIREYRKSLAKVHKSNPKLNESGTRLLINDFLRNVLCFEPNEEIKTEYEIAGGYADYVLQTGRKKRVVVEVKALGIKLNANHLRQSLGYAASEGIDWILLLNGKQFQLYKVMFAKPVFTKLVFDIDLLSDSGFKNSTELFEMMTKKSLAKNTLDSYWKKVDSLEPQSLAKYFFDETVIKLLKRNLKNKTRINFSNNDIFDSVYQIVINKIELPKPKFRTSKNKPKIETGSQSSPASGVQKISL